MNETQAFPLCWPESWQRTAPSKRQADRFGKHDRYYDQQGHRQTGRLRELSVADGVKRVTDELQKLGCRDIIVSTNIPVKRDGMPYSARQNPTDPGVAVYWQSKKGRRCIAIDRYTTVAGNLGAIAATLSAMRAIERHGSAEILERVFTGFAQLPPPGKRPWWQVLGMMAACDDLAAAERVYRMRARELHPDAGGSHDQFAELSAAISEAREILK